MAKYRLSQAAEEDLDRLYEYGALEFGERQADVYYEGLIKRFQEIAESPRLWQAVDHIRSGYRRTVHRRHAVYYQIEDEQVIVVRILGREDSGALL